MEVKGSELRSKSVFVDDYWLLPLIKYISNVYYVTQWKDYNYSSYGLN